MKSKISIFFLAVLLFSAGLLLNISYVSAYDFENSSGLGQSGNAAGYQEANLTHDSFAITVGKVIRIGIIFLGVFFFLLMIYAGFKWMLSRGNSQDVDAAKKIMQNAVIGLIVILLAYGVTYFVMTILSSPQR